MRKTIVVNVSEDFHRAVKTKAAERNTTITQLIIEALTEYTNIYNVQKCPITGKRNQPAPKEAFDDPGID